MRDFDQSEQLADSPPHAVHSAPADAALGRALALVRFLRSRCPWDARQDPWSLRPYLLEEAHEVADAIAAEDDRALAGELGDLLLNLAFQVVLGEERDAFDAAVVVARMEAKMRARHPHIYGDAAEAPEWEALKALERQEAAAGEESATSAAPPAATAAWRGSDRDPFRGVPVGLEPLSRALRVQERMAALGFDWPDVTGPLAKIREEADEAEARLGAHRAAADAAPTPEADEGRAEAEGPADIEAGADAEALAEEIGDLLFAVVNLARMVGVHPSNALLRATAKFETRSREIRRLAADRGLDWEDASLAELDLLWEETKRAESQDAERKPESEP